MAASCSDYDKTDNFTKLYQAIRSDLGLETVLNILYQGDVDVNRQHSGGQSCLHAAVIRGNIETVQVPLHAGANVNAVDEHGNSCLRAAVVIRNAEIVHVLLENGADVNAVDERGQSCLHVAVWRNKENIVRLLLANGADVNVVDEDGRSRHIVAFEQDKESIVRLLLANGANVNDFDEDGRSRLLVAVEQDKESIVCLLLANGAGVNAVDKDGESCLHAAVWQNMVRLFLANGADVNAVDKGGFTPLCESLQQGKFSVTCLLISAGADCRTQIKDGHCFLDEVIKLDMDHTQAIIDILDLMVSGAYNLLDDWHFISERGVLYFSKKHRKVVYWIRARVTKQEPASLMKLCRRTIRRDLVLVNGSILEGHVASLYYFDLGVYRHNPNLATPHLYGYCYISEDICNYILMRDEIAQCKIKLGIKMS